MHFINRPMWESSQHYITTTAMVPFLGVPFMLAFFQSNCVGAIKRILFCYRHIFAFFHVFVCSLLLPSMLLSVLRCVWEWRRYTMQLLTIVFLILYCFIQLGLLNSSKANIISTFVNQNIDRPNHRRDLRTLCAPLVSLIWFSFHFLVTFLWPNIFAFRPLFPYIACCISPAAHFTPAHRTNASFSHLFFAVVSCLLIECVVDLMHFVIFLLLYMKRLQLKFDLC